VCGWLAPAYHSIDQDIVGAVVTRDIPELRRRLAVIIGELAPDD